MEIAVLLPGTTNLTNKEIETSVQALNFELTGPHGGAILPGAILEAVVGNAEINIQKQDGHDTQSLIQSLGIRDLAEIATHNDGVIMIVVTGANATVSFGIEIANLAALTLNDQAKLMMAISGLPVTTGCIIDGLDSAINTSEYIKYESKYVNANVSKDFGIDAAYAMALPIGNVKALEMTYTNGKNVKLSKREIKSVLTNSQDPIYNLDGRVIFGFDKFAVLSVEHVVSVRVTLDISTNFYLLKNQTV